MYRRQIVGSRKFLTLEPAIKARRNENQRIEIIKEKNRKLCQYLTERSYQQGENEFILDFSERLNLEIKVDPRLVACLKKHQIEGIRFMYDSCYGSIDNIIASQDKGSGCVLAHCMGLGKTLSCIALLNTIINYDALGTRKILIICPKSTIYNWCDEFEKWLEGFNVIKVRCLGDNLDMMEKVRTIELWQKSTCPSVFIINYECYRILINWKGPAAKSKNPWPRSRILQIQRRIHKLLLRTADLVVLDEGHAIKNENSTTAQSVKMIETRRRIVLSGTPVQNNLNEYFSMINWIKPYFLGDKHEFSFAYALPIRDGQNKDSEPDQILLMKQRCFVLNATLVNCLHRKEVNTLREFLPPKFEYSIHVPLTALQEKLYNTYLETIDKQKKKEGSEFILGKKLFASYTALRKVWTHPKILRYSHELALEKSEQKKMRDKKRAQQLREERAARGEEEEEESDEEGDENNPIDETAKKVNRNPWWSGMITEDDEKSLYASHKMRILFEILKLAQEDGEKVLVFSSFVVVLNVIEQFMGAIHHQSKNMHLAYRYGYDRYKASWRRNIDYFRLDGSTPKDLRQKMIKKFNEPDSTARCFLISAKAGGQGINLISANRVVIVDTSWNPQTDNQSIFRIYRMGQERACFIYRLVATGTMEERIYSRSVTKEALSHRVVEKKQIERHYARNELEELFFKYQLKHRGVVNFPRDANLRHLIYHLQDSVHDFHEHDSLLENKPEDDLSEEEKKEAWNAYVSTKQSHQQYNAIGFPEDFSTMNSSLQMPSILESLARPGDSDGSNSNALDNATASNYSRASASSPQMAGTASQPKAVASLQTPKRIPKLTDKFRNVGRYRMLAPNAQKTPTVRKTMNNSPPTPPPPPSTMENNSRPLQSAAAGTVIKEETSTLSSKPLASVDLDTEDEEEEKEKKVSIKSHDEVPKSPVQASKRKSEAVFKNTRFASAKKAKRDMMK